MKNYIQYFALALAAFTLGSCSSGEDGPAFGALTLKASKSAITANGSDKAEFTVTKDGNNVTADSEIYQIASDGSETKLDNPYFTTSQSGTYTFKAHYNNEVSAAATVTASDQTTGNEKYYRNVAIFKFTGTWCSFCPVAGRQLDDLASRSYKDRIIQLAFHGGASDEPMLVPETDVLFKLFKCESYPAAITDMRTVGETSGTTSLIGVTREAVQKSLDEHPATCGIRIDSKVAAGKFDITVGVTSNTGGNYRAAAYLLESKLVYRQLDGQLYKDDFQHNHVVRKLLSKTVMGDSTGALAADQEKTLTYSIDVDKAWNVDNMMVAVYVLDETETINNAAECEANNGSIEYRLNQ